jgi:predicted GNAT superfamily acetyltransferase
VAADLVADDDVRARARAHSEQASARAGVVVRELVTRAEFDDARMIWDTVWPVEAGATEVTSHLMRALHHAGAYVGGAYVGEEMVGSCLAFVARSRDVGGGWHTHLHSHIAGALPGRADRGLGTALKVHQRAWALAHGIDLIEWTFDPLVRRNARLNLVKLGGVAVEYHVDFYGEMSDGVNAGDESDRFILRWELASERVDAALSGMSAPPTREALIALGAEQALADVDGEPRVRAASAPVRLVALPEDIVGVRAADPARAARWRAAVREVVAPVVSAGGRAVSLTSEGDYVLEVMP